MSTRWRRVLVARVSDATGTTLVEAAIVTPLLLLVTFAIVDFGVMYRLCECPSDRPNTGPITLDAYGGARYTSLSIEVDPANFPARERGQAWVDPIVGLKVVAPLCPKWEVQGWADVGGFGAGSDLTWSATAVLGYNFELFDHPATLFGGYRGIGYGSSRSDLNVTLMRGETVLRIQRPEAKAAYTGGRCMRFK